MEKGGVAHCGVAVKQKLSDSALGGFDQAIIQVGNPSGKRFRGYEQIRRSSPGRGLAMAHEIAKLLLEKAGTFLERTEAIKVALQMGMPLNEIQEYLDWLDSMRPLQTRSTQPPGSADDVPPDAGKP